MSSFPSATSHRHVVEGPAPVPENVGRGYVPRRARLYPDDFTEHGYTQGCKGCQFMQTGIGVRYNHNDACRQRMEDKLDETEEGRVRLGRSKGRIDHWVADSENKNVEEDNPPQPEAGEGAVLQPEAGTPEHEDMDVKDNEGEKDKEEVEEQQLSNRQNPRSDTRVGTPRGIRQ